MAKSVVKLNLQEQLKVSKVLNSMETEEIGLTEIAAAVNKAAVITKVVGPTHIRTICESFEPQIPYKQIIKGNAKKRLDNFEQRLEALEQLVQNIIN